MKPMDPEAWKRLDELEARFRLYEELEAAGLIKLETPAEARKRQDASLRAFLKRQALHQIAGFAAKAQASGTGEVRPRRVHWDVSNGCELPREVEMVIHPVGVVTLTVACRTACERCLWRRKVFWAHRAKYEIQVAQRSWFGTLTLRPNAQAAAKAKAIRRAMQNGVNWNELTPGDAFARIHKEVVHSLQLWMKRVRKLSGARLRYLMVVEAHESGDPHYHCLVHEVPGSAPVTERELRLAWTQHGGGHTSFVLVRDDDPRAAFYVCKYLSKSALCRVQASNRYGSWGPGVETPGPISVSRKEETKKLSENSNSVKSDPPKGAPFMVTDHG